MWANWNLRETLPDPFTPLTWSLWLDSILPAAVEPLVGISRKLSALRQLIAVDLVEGRLDWNMNVMLGTYRGTRFMRRMFAAFDPQAWQIINRLERDR